MLGVRYERERRDRDGDGVPDTDDQCPDIKEDLDGFQDEDGCPEGDNDGDHVPDVEDGCPMEKGPREYDGCPDRDGDQIPDNVDKCPDEPGDPQAEGCPENAPAVELESERIRIRGNIMFETGEAIIQKQSYKLLDDVAKVLNENPQIGPVLIEGHTDDRGSSAYNQNLSDRRAKAVADYLVGKNVKRKRLRSRGFGEEKPIADNETPLGRAKNRRTEFKLVKDEETSSDGTEVKMVPSEKGTMDVEVTKPPQPKAPPADGEKPAEEKKP
jgi:OOP family OmpA-OmpF porin